MLTSSGERALAYTVRIDEIVPIPGTDKEGNPYTKVEYARVGGWWVIVKAGEFKVNDIAIYVEIDAMLPEWPVFEFLRPKKFRIKSQKMCSVLSQGIIFSVGRNGIISEEKAFAYLGEEYRNDFEFTRTGMFPWETEINYDLTALLEIKKYEPLEDKRFLPGAAKGHFPSFLKKTDQERVQNLGRALENYPWNYEVTEKLDGSSMTVYFNNNEIGVCSRNMNLKPEPPEKEKWNEGEFWKTAKKLHLIEIVERMYHQLGIHLALQGELIGPGIQKNKYKLEDYTWMCFDIWDIDEHRYLLPTERRNLCLHFGIPHVPVIEGYMSDRYFNEIITVAKLLEFAQGNTVIGNNPSQKREGLVFKHNTQNFSFKAVNNQFLLEEK